MTTQSPRLTRITIRKHCEKERPYRTTTTTTTTTSVHTTTTIKNGRYGKDNKQPTRRSEIWQGRQPPNDASFGRPERPQTDETIDCQRRIDNNQPKLSRDGVYENNDNRHNQKIRTITIWTPGDNNRPNQMTTTSTADINKNKQTDSTKITIDQNV